MEVGVGVGVGVGWVTGPDGVEEMVRCEGEGHIVYVASSTITRTIHVM